MIKFVITNNRLLDNWFSMTNEENELDEAFSQFKAKLKNMPNAKDLLQSMMQKMLSSEQITSNSTLKKPEIVEDILPKTNEKCVISKKKIVLGDDESQVSNIPSKFTDLDKLQKEVDVEKFLQEQEESAQKLKEKACKPKTPPKKAKFSDLRIMLWSTIYRKTLDSLPMSVEELRQQVIKSVISSWEISISDSDFNMFFYDLDGEKWSLDTQGDLDWVYKMALKATPPWIKVIVEIERGVNGGEELESIKRKRKASRKFVEVDSDFDSNSDDDQWFVERFTFDCHEVDSLTLIREGYEYIVRHGPKHTVTKGHLLNVYDWTMKHWKGRWETQPLMFNGEYGRLLISHNLPLEDHDNNDDRIIAKYVETLLHNYQPSEETLIRSEVRKLIKALGANDPNLTATEVLLMIKKAFPKAHLLNKQQADGILASVRIGKGGKGDLGHIEPRDFVTMRKTVFSRGTSFSMINGNLKYFAYFISDFQEQIAKEVADDQNLHIFLDGTFKCCPRRWNQLLNIWVLHRGKNLYIPVGHVLMQSSKLKAYINVLGYVNHILNLNPKYITVDFEKSLINSWKEVYPNSQLVPWFFHFVKCLWMNASKWGLRKRNSLSQTKELIFSLKALAFRLPETVFKHFERIKNKYFRASQAFATYLEYFEATWMDGEYKINDWNYHDKLSQFEELSLTNNGLESFHQMIHSQLKRNTPSFKGFIAVLGKVEAMKKLHYDSDKIKGDPQYNRLWPIATIFRELYVNKPSDDAENFELDIKSPGIRNKIFNWADAKPCIVPNNVNSDERRNTEDPISNILQTSRQWEDYFSIICDQKAPKDVYILNNKGINKSSGGEFPSNKVIKTVGNEAKEITAIRAKGADNRAFMPKGMEEIEETDGDIKRFLDGDFGSTKPLYFKHFY
jgi:hypothetical protein